MVYFDGRGTAPRAGTMKSTGSPTNIAPDADPRAFYRERYRLHEAAAETARRLDSRLSDLRLLAALTGLGACLVLAWNGLPVPGLACAGIAAAAFAALVVRHRRVERLLAAEGRLRDLNRDGLARLDEGWKDFPARGEEFREPGHAFADDLDILGRASLFQRICAAETRLGRARLAAVLTRPALEREGILARQAMVEELAGLTGWRQAFQAAGRELSSGKEDPEALLRWAGADSGPPPSRAFRLALLGWGLAAFPAGIAAAAAFRIPALALAPLLLNGGLWLLTQGRNRLLLAGLGAQRRSLEAYRTMLRLIESGAFAHPSLAAVAAAVTRPAGPASEGIGDLADIADWIDVRQNPLVHAILNLACLWDLHWVTAFRCWKARDGAAVGAWLGCIAEFEALASLALLRFEHPGWAYPTLLSGGETRFRARALGHPLLPADKGVRNDFHLDGSERVAVLTGSNMTGKSTFLRTVGVNLVLAYAGAPVCGEGMETGLFRVHTSMRIRDDLEGGVSSFYAEVLRIRSILGALEDKGGYVLFLIDEIFRGTNSVDRIAGAEGVLRQLASLGAMGLVSTHDLELSRLADVEPGRFRNFHFMEHFVDGTIRFDYRLRPGVATTRNALHLMRLAGISTAAVEESAGPGPMVKS